ncbi:MAG: hypothetical protein AB8B77_05365 [Alphaproteobacteria bacterium]
MMESVSDPLASGLQNDADQRLPRLNRQQSEQLVSAKITDMAHDADFVVLVMYDREQGLEPVDYHLYDFQKGASPADVPTDLNYEGIWVWYFCNRNGENFQARKLLIEMIDGHYGYGQFGDFEGFWDEFPQYVAKDRWVETCI